MKLRSRLYNTFFFAKAPTSYRDLRISVIFTYVMQFGSNSIVELYTSMFSNTYQQLLVH